MATLDDSRAGAAPWLLSAPALLLFLALLLVPLLLTFVLSFHVFSDIAGVQRGWTVTNYLEVLSDPYYGEIFLRTAGLAFAVTLLSIVLGVPETLVLARMRRPWQSVCLLIVLGPLLISVVVRTLGWQILLGNNGVLNNALQALHITDEPIRLVYTMTGTIIALTHVLVPFMVMSVWATLQKLDPQVDWAGRSRGASPLRVFRRVI
ncbi:ABC transporter permease, partial [Paraburkholderia sp. BR14261]